ncbi:hypothetical protein KAFR_0F04310 [Kazachstania africana CBS 2517]|uniref:Late endosomal/lysosomal adaptor and MAPK and MTOR activator 5 n=1 Tax=Kazachstania africana (strain ATCC 22294 / BCRC 22015 / CBS 2517 / CECT 1963 / NBRC 1671 / NRRL Y-8276) TaxID=1071382 RepID=H2AXC6_KAZAF|nr:hypothetical protein KAFR_0F04310 [Kazachstania africana CBS 2517]CCF59026.1 hypothetical protein KAFR_0F04310 [Kazachstania africana CBS 2517]
MSRINDHLNNGLTTIPNTIGTILFDENNNLIQYSGIGEAKFQDIQKLCKVPLDKEGYAVVKDPDNDEIKIFIYKNDEKTLVTYTRPDELIH